MEDVEVKKMREEKALKWQRTRFEADMEAFKKYQKKKELQAKAHNSQSHEIEFLLQKFE